MEVGAVIGIVLGTLIVALAMRCRSKWIVANKRAKSWENKYDDLLVLNNRHYTSLTENVSKLNDTRKKLEVTRSSLKASERRCAEGTVDTYKKDLENSRKRELALVSKIDLLEMTPDERVKDLMDTVVELRDKITEEVGKKEKWKFKAERLSGTLDKAKGKRSFNG